MAKSKEQVIQDQLGAMMFQIAVLVADLDAAREEIATLKLPTEHDKPAPALKAV